MTLNPGDLLFVGWDADNNDITFVTTVNFPAGEVIYFTDEQWDGTDFFSTEQLIEWTVPPGGVSAGTVVNIQLDPGTSSATIDAGGTFDYIRGNYQIGGGNEMFWAFQGTRTGNDVTPSNFIAVIANEADGTDAQTPNLANTGLTTSNGAVIIDGDEDYMEWVGDAVLPNPVTRQELIDSVMNLSNWVTADGNGNNNPNITGFDILPPNIVCFAAGTLILCETTPVPIELLTVGMKVRRANGTTAAIRWIGKRKLSAADLAANPHLRPIRISRGALGQGLPKRDLLVSHQHRMQLSSRVAQRMFGLSDVLIPAFKLINMAGIYVDDTVREIEYFHLLFDDHEIIFAEGAPTESLFTGPEAMKSIPPDCLKEIFALFPNLKDAGHQPCPALFIPKRNQMDRLLERHVKNSKPVLEIFELDTA